MGIVVLGAVFVDIKGYPSDVYIPGGRNAGRVEQMHGGVSRNIVEDIANVELERILFPDKYQKISTYIEPDYPYIHRELAKPGVTLTPVSYTHLTLPTIA